MLIVLVLLFFAATYAKTQQTEAVFLNGQIWTVDSLQPTAEAIAVSRGRIIAVGSEADIESLITPQTKRIDLKGRRVLPGFIDNHTHFMSGGFQLQNLDLRDSEDEMQFAIRIRRRAEQYPGRWITGGDWDHDRWPGGNPPTRALIGQGTVNTPVFVSRYDGHMALANTYALRLAGITKDTQDPPGGAIVRDPRSGEPTGLLKDEAMSLVYRLIPDPSEAEMLEAARLALAEARRYGLTGIQDMSTATDLQVWQLLKSRGELTTRFYCRLPISETKHLIGAGIHVPFGDDWIKIGSLKAFADGSLGSSTALFFEPFTSDTTTHGLASDIVLDGRFQSWATSADSAGLQISVHAIGDSANSLMLDLFEQITANNRRWDRRFRIEHAQHIDPKDLGRFRKLNVIASVQPYHAIDDGRWAEKRIGYDRCKEAYPFRSFLDHGVRLCFGSDWTVAPLNPLLGIYAAVTRRTLDGAHPGGWIPEQRITVEEAIRAYTLNNAYASFEENEKGSISVGKFADFVVLSEDILAITPERIESVKVDMTVLGGIIVHERRP